MKYVLTMVLLAILNTSFGLSQDAKQEINAFADTSCKCTFLLPKWFTVERNLQHRDVLNVLESGKFSFKIVTISVSEHNYEYERYIGKSHTDSNDVFLQIAKEATFYNGALNYHGLVEYARIDSLKEFRSPNGLRVIVTYRTVVDLAGSPIDNEELGPLYFIDTSAFAKGNILEFDYSWFNMKDATYRDLALTVALSVQHN